MSEVNSLSSHEDSASPMDLAEAQLLQELRSMFDVDTQTYLHSYFSLVQQLQPNSWIADIQELYRCVHTIKGGAVTVGAEGILHVSTVLEDLLSDLRYLKIAPPLEDGSLAQMLLEAGEFLTNSLEVKTIGDDAKAGVQPSVDRIVALRNSIQQVYMPESNERTQLFQEFADQGFDLVVLDLDMALEHLPSDGKVPDAALKTAKQTLQQLLQIGKDLEFEPGWLQLLRRSQVLLTRQDNIFWKAKWPAYLRLLKDTARQGGKLSASIAQKLGIAPVSIPDQTLANLPQTDVAIATPPTAPEPPLTLITPDVEVEQLPLSRSPVVNDLEQLPTKKPAKTSAASAPKTQIPVPLERLDRSAQNLVETLLAARASQGSYQALELQLVKLVALAQDSAEYITRLRQLQDDYALLSDSDPGTASTSGPTVERYRQGYTIVNRLLETSLRLSELGAEVTTSAHQTSDNLQLLERNVLNLQQTVEESRLIPFRTLALRAKGILRDLINRMGKPAQLIVEGELIELDAGTSQALEPILLHLIRNAYDHGLESNSDRQATGKPAQGKVSISLRRQGNSYLLNIQDDGGGINPATIQQLALAKGLPLTRTDTPANLLATICQSGFSTQTLVSDISGRGVGMDVVAAQILSLGGRLSLDTTLGVGTIFRMQIPVPQLLVRCVLIRAGDRTFAIPTDEIVTTTLWSNLSVTPAADHLSYSWQVELEGTTMPALDLLHYWKPDERRRSLSETALCLRIRSSAIASSTNQLDAWLIADDLLGQDDLLINQLPHPLQAPVGMMGVSLQADGKLLPILEPPALAAHLLSAAADMSDSQSQSTFPDITTYLAPPVERETSISTATKTILVVDDAALMRRRMEASLTAYGYIVQTCNDGLEAWKWLQSNPHPAILITDIEMPGMDGFTLIDRCKQNSMNFPILVISSRLSEEWSKEAKRLGATDYLTKGFSTPELISKVSSYLNREPVLL
jgi:chemotaxis protein histidine kinase CheA/ActR/RegA family two-component response regulator